MGSNSKDRHAHGLRRALQEGSALLTVLWAAAALAAITLALAHTVRSEAERATTSTDALRAYYLATSAIDRALLWIEWGNGGITRPNSDIPYYQAPTPVIRMEFPEGVASVEVVPELSKLNINTATPEELTSLIGAAGAPEQAEAIAAAIVDWRSTQPGDAITGFDTWYLSRQPSFRAPHASFQEIEELLLVRGMTPELYYGGYTHDAQGRAVPYGGLRDCVSVYGSTGPFDINTVRPQLMLAVGLAPPVVSEILARRSAAVIRDIGELGPVAENNPAMSRLHVSDLNTGTIWTLRATARARLSDGRLSSVPRSVAAMIKFLPPGTNPPWHIMRWYDDMPRIETAPDALAPAGQVIPRG